jgi:type I restriction enzyme S subunit
MSEGTLPDGWRWVKLGEISDVVSGSTPSSGVEENWNGSIVWVTPTDLGKLEGKYITTSERLITEAAYNSCSATFVPKGTIVMSSRAPIGHLGIADVELCTNQGCKSFVPGSGVHTDFLYYVLLLSVPEFQELGSGATFKEISKSVLAEYRVPLPPLPEQHRIAAILNEQMAAVEEARAAAEAELAAAESLAAAYLREVFESKQLQDFCRLVDLILIGPDNGLYKPSEFIGTGVSLIDIGCLYHGYTLDLGVARRVEASEDELARYSVTIGDILINRVSKKPEGVGKAVWINQLTELAVYESNMMRVRVNLEKALPAFIVYYLASDDSRKELLSKANITNQANINQGAIASLKIPVVSLSEQRRIVRLLDNRMESIATLITSNQENLDLINALPAALLRRAFNGEL